MRDPAAIEAKLSKSASIKGVIHDNLWYGIIVILSLAVLILFPMIGSGLPLSLTFPTTLAGWMVYVFSKVAVAAINIFIFHGFMQQGQLNVAHYWKKIIADEILHRIKVKRAQRPLSPEEWAHKEYKHKGISIVVTSILSCLALSQVILSFDFIIFISFLLTLMIGLIFGVMQLFKSETYWSWEYYEYALYTMNKYNATAELKLEVRGKSLYEGGILIYECE